MSVQSSEFVTCVDSSGQVADITDDDQNDDVRCRGQPNEYINTHGCM